jgi:hypothetical protein
MIGQAQNILKKALNADAIKSILIDGNQIFSISVETSKIEDIVITSTLDGEYQNEFQIITKYDGSLLMLKLEHLAFSKIADDKRNAHKVIAATLHLEIPENLSLNITSDIGSVNAIGNFDMLSIELLQGYCKVKGSAKIVVINTIDGKIDVVTKYGKFIASSKNGKVTKDDFEPSELSWNLKSINGDITVVKEE